MRKPKSPAELHRTVDDWNREHPVGTEVLYFPVLGDFRNFRRRATKAPASVLSDHTAVLWLDGERGCVALDHCEVVAS